MGDIWIIDMNVFASALAGHSPTPTAPVDFDLKVSLLPTRRAAFITRTVHQGQFDGFICEGELWVRRADIHDLLPPGHCTYDPDDACCFIPWNLIRPEDSDLAPTS